VNLNPVSVMPGGYAAARFATVATSDGHDFLFIDTDENSHTVYAVCSGHVRMVRSIPLASGSNPLIHSLETNLRRTFTAMHEKLGVDIQPSKVFSSGPRAKLLAAGNGSSSLLGMPVASIEVIRNYTRLKGALKTPEWETGNLDIALSLALMESEAIGGINFSTQRSTIQHFWGEHRGSIILTAVFIALTLAIVLAGQVFEVREKRHRLAEMDRQIEAVFKQTFPEVTRIHAPLQQMQIKINEAGAGSAGLESTGNRARVIDILNTLSRQIPPSAEIKIDRLVLGADNLVLSGRTDTFNTVDDIKGGLEGAEMFKQVTISSADLEKSGKGVRFKLKLDF